MSNGMLGGITLATVAGLINDLFQKLIGPDGEEWLTALKKFLRKENPWLCVIDCDKEPNMHQNNWSIRPEDQLQNVVRGKVIFNPDDVAFQFNKGHQKTRSFVGEHLRDRLTDQPVMPANILDVLVEHPWLIPKSWKTRDTHLYFWGTIYRDAEGRMLVRSLCINDAVVDSGYIWVHL